MTSSMTTGVLIAMAVAAGGTGVAGYGLISRTRYAEVLEVQPVRKTVRAPHEACADVIGTQPRPPGDPGRISGAAAGAAADQRVPAPASGGAQPVAVRRCSTVEDVRLETVGYDVRYRLGDSINVVRLRDPPADSRLELRDGRPIVESGAAPQT